MATIPDAQLAQINRWIDDAVTSTSVYDLHTHLYPPAFEKLMLWGIEELLTYHYLVAETMRATTMPYEQFWAMSKPQQSDLIWKTLFVDRAPISEACRGVLTVLKHLGLKPGADKLGSIRQYFAGQTAQGYVDTVFKAANVHTVVMTNDPLEPVERDYWMNSTPVDPRFKTVLRIDPILLGWPNVAQTLSGLGYKTSSAMDATTMKEVRRFITDWMDRLKPLYVAVSLPPAWRYPDESPTTKVIREVILPITKERNLPFAMMVGVNKLVNPALKLAGDAVAKSDIDSVHRICTENPKNKFMFTMLARENTHELAVAARKHRNLFLFGCWWFLNNPVLIEEMTRIRMELLGTLFVPQHSDARVLDQIIYKWDHSRQIIAKVMKDKFADLAATGWDVTEQQVQKTARQFLSDNFTEFLHLSL